MYYSWMELCSGHGHSVFIRELSLLAKLTVDCITGRQKNCLFGCAWHVHAHVWPVCTEQEARNSASFIPGLVMSTASASNASSSSSRRTEKTEEDRLRKEAVLAQFAFEDEDDDDDDNVD